ncbi:opsin-VA-like [Phyllopteryx taeniolatus]|uniref:opsin-VA-like n=1 Tax=Phyllopteryx taeniolatus TaxID=161469 RepID=UPI002AD31F87|nr:opsin-VA-like [Phyllopteryx taeniolatus]
MRWPGSNLSYCKERADARRITNDKIKRVAEPSDFAPLAPWTATAPLGALKRRNPTLLHPMNVFILSLAVSDLMFAPRGSPVVTVTDYRGSSFMGRAACVFQGFAVNYFVFSFQMNKSVELQVGHSLPKETDHAVTMVLGMTPLSVMVVLEPLLYVPPLLGTMPVYFTKTSPVYNPVTYFLSNKRARATLTRRRRRRGGPDTETDS